MKKLIAFLLILATMPMTAFSENVDLKKMGIEDLLALQSRVCEEIGIRLSESSMPIYTGVYEVGVSIAAGDYILTLTSQREGYAGELLVFASKRAYNDYHTYLATYEPTLYLDDVQINMPIHLSLAEGEMLLIGHGNWTLIKTK